MAKQIETYLSGQTMYQIKYYDEMSGKTLDVVSSNLDEAVSAIKRARDELYFKGSTSIDPKIDVGYEKRIDEEMIPETAKPDPKEIVSPWGDDDQVKYAGLYFGEID